MLDRLKGLNELSGWLGIGLGTADVSDAAQSKTNSTKDMRGRICLAIPIMDHYCGGLLQENSAGQSIGQVRA